MDNTSVTEEKALEADNNSDELLSEGLEILDGIPEPIKENFWLVFKRLCTAAVDYPVAHLEGKAAEKRAETDARIKIIEQVNSQICNQIKVHPEYGNLASLKFAEKIVREQINLDKIVKTASNQFSKECDKAIKDTNCEDKVPLINDDWLNSFEKEACLKSTEQMQSLFGKILAGEIKKPSSFSIKTIKIIGQLDAEVAKLFQILCSISVSIKIDNKIVDSRVISLNGEASQNSLGKYGLSFNSLNILQEHGLIIQDYNSWFDYRFCIDNGMQAHFPFNYQNMNYVLVTTNDDIKSNELKLHGVALTKAGQELLSIVDFEPNLEYTSALKDFFKSKHLELVRIE